MNNIIFGIHGSENYEGGNYNILASFGVGLYKALQRKQLNADYFHNSIKKNLIPNISISFNGTGAQDWNKILDTGITQIMWNVDSVFYQNYHAIKYYSENYPNFVVFNVSQSDNEPIKRYLPQLKNFYVPHGVDPELWQGNDSKKEFDIILTSNLIDYEEELKSIKESLNKDSYKIFMELYEQLMDNPQKTFWDNYKYFAEHIGIDLNDSILYQNFFFINLCYIVTHAKRVKLIKSLKDFNVKVWGADVWEKYIEGKVEYMGSTNLFDTIKNTQKAKIALHLQPLQISAGLHERVLNASLAGAMVVSDEAPCIMEAFGDNFVYYNNHTFDNLSSNIEYYLKNECARNEKVQKAKQITLKNHTWEHRVDKILKLVST